MRNVSVAAAASLVAACTPMFGSGAHLRALPPGRDVAMSADYRVIFRRGDVSCAEPSPDVARAVESATKFDLKGSASGAKIQPELALALAASRAESVAQLGQRLATIQLLRDSTFKACEAFANKAIDASTYAMVVSRYDDVMVTLLLGEAAGGGFAAARQAMLTGSAGTLPVGGELGQTVLRGAQERAAATAAELKAAEAALKTADALPADDTTRAAKVEAAQQRVDAAKAADRIAAGQVDVAVRVTSGTQAAASGQFSGPNGAPTDPAVTTAKVLGAMQAKYLDDFNLDAIMVGCMSALSQRPEHTTPLPAVHAGVLDGYAATSPAGAVTIQDECRALLRNGATLSKMADALAELLRAKAAAMTRRDEAE